jgi:hypothetical protein
MPMVVANACSIRTGHRSLKKNFLSNICTPLPYAHGAAFN